MSTVAVWVWPPPVVVMTEWYRPVPAVARATVAMKLSVADPPATKVTLEATVKGRLALPGVEMKAKLIVAVTVIVPAKLLMLPKLSVDTAVANGSFLNTVTVSGAAVSE